MKVRVEFDLTPEEAREIMGLPNVSHLHEMFLNAAQEKMQNASNYVDIEPLMKTWSGFGGMAQDAFSNFLNAAIKASATPTTDTSKK